MNDRPDSTQWRFLIVEDDELKLRQLTEVLEYCVDEPDTVEVQTCRAFRDASKLLKTQRFDLLILDLKDDSDTSADSESEAAGLQIFEELKKVRFVPVVFYTALAHKVASQATSFVRVVEKTQDVTKVRDEIRGVLGTGLPALTRHLEELQRSYLWDFVSTHWKEFESSRQQTDLAYLLARRLALTLQREAGQIASRISGVPGGSSASTNIHPMEMYVRPSIGPVPLAGDILVETDNLNNKLFWLLLTPSCDFAQGKAEHVVLAKCERLEAQKEYIDWTKNQAASAKGLEALIGDNRSGKRESLVEDVAETFKLQPERFKFLPGTYFMPDLVIDFQQLRSIPCQDLRRLQILASLDSPFAEAVLARFSRFFSRLGTPDIDKRVVLSRLEATMAPPQSMVS